jgi:hypothetical protein
MTRSGFFRTQKIDGRHWLLDPDGKRFISKGVCSVRYDQDRIQGTKIAPYAASNDAKYGSVGAWREAAARRLFDLGFNSLGAWADAALADRSVDGQKLAYCPILDFGAGFVADKTHGGQAWLHGIFPDVFDPEFEDNARARAKRLCAPLAGDARIIGYFTDNELRWGPDWRGTDELLTLFLALPSSAPGKRAAVQHLSLRHHDIASLNQVWGTSFASFDGLAVESKVLPPYVMKALWEQNQEVERVENHKDPRRAAFAADCTAFAALLAERYFRITAEAIREADPNHMNFGARFAYVPQRDVIARAAPHLDVISFNCYAFEPMHALDAYGVHDKPCILGEFSFRGDDAGLPNTRGAGPRVPTQADRAAAFETFVARGLRSPWLVGYHWFEHADEPKEGRFDGENSNYGIVNIEDELYEELAGAMKRVNRTADEIHQRG